MSFGKWGKKEGGELTLSPLRRFYSIAKSRPNQWPAVSIARLYIKMETGLPKARARKKFRKLILDKPASIQRKSSGNPGKKIAATKSLGNFSL